MGNEASTESFIAHHFLEVLEPQYREMIAECATTATFRAGEFVCHEGAPANWFYIIEKGKIALETFAPARGPIIIETIGAEEVLGWSWLFPPYRWHFDALALEDTTCVAFDAMCLRGKIETNHELGYELLKQFSRVMLERLQATRLRLIDIYHAVPNIEVTMPA